MGGPELMAARSPLDAIGDALDRPMDAPDMAQPGDLAPYGGHDEDPDGRPPLPADCPVQVLGVLRQVCWYLDTNGQIIDLEMGNRHGKNSLLGLFGTKSGWLERNYPQWSAPVYEGRGKDRQLVKPSEIVGFDQAEASRAMIEACCAKGIFDPAGKIRGRGAHRGRQGGLIVHVGDKVLAAKMHVDGTIGKFDWHGPGVSDGYVYPAAAPIPRPWHKKADGRPGRDLLALLKTWMWQRTLLDPMLALGWIGLSYVGGAVEWRSNIWLTGGPGTGKSTLNGEGGVFDQLFGEGLFKTGNASAAAIRQTLKNSTVPVMFDEIEASEDNRRVREVIELARVSSSGTTIHRGGADHVASEFTLRSCFQFSSVLIPPIEPQDRSRLAILELKRFPEGAVPPKLATFNLPALGAMLYRRMVDGWARWDETLHAYDSALAAGGHSRRACMQFGSLLAAAHILLYDDLSDAELIAEWAGRCDRRWLSEVSEATPDEEDCTNHILTSMVQSRGGDEREAIGTWIGRAVNMRSGNEDFMTRARKQLQEIGLKLVNAVPKDPGPQEEQRFGARDLEPGKPGYLAIAQSHQALAAIFAGRKWQGGVWAQSLARHEGAIRGVDVKMGHVKVRAVLIPLAHVLDESELPDGSPTIAELRKART